MVTALKIIRSVKNVSQKEIAGILGVSRQTYCKMENNPETITLGEAKKISDYLQVDPLKIFFKNEVSLNDIR